MRRSRFNEEIRRWGRRLQNVTLLNGGGATLFDLPAVNTPQITGNTQPKRASPAPRSMWLIRNKQFLNAIVARLLPFDFAFFFSILAFLLFQFFQSFFLFIIRPFLHKISRRQWATPETEGPRTGRGPSAVMRYFILTTLAAAGPLAPSTTLKLTRSPSWRDLNP